jgi:hypothetical protein
MSTSRALAAIGLANVVLIASSFPNQGPKTLLVSEPRQQALGRMSVLWKPTLLSRRSRLS